MAVLTSMGRAPIVPADAYIEDSTDKYVVQLALPGFRVDDLEVEVADHVVTIRGERVRAEFGAFNLHDRLEERLELPADADPDSLTASYRSERLALRVPRLSEGAPTRKIRISASHFMNPEASGV